VSANLNARYFRIRFDQTIQLLELEDKSAQRVCVDIHSSINRLRATERAEEERPNSLRRDTSERKIEKKDIIIRAHRRVFLGLEK